MSRPKVLPDDVKQICLSMVKGYDRRRAEYLSRVQDILAVDTPTATDAVVGSNHASRVTENMATRLEKLEELPDTKRMRAVEHALNRVGLDLPKDLRKCLTRAILTSCTQGRKYPFERLAVEGMERSSFYDRRTRFLVDIAKYLELI